MCKKISGVLFFVFCFLFFAPVYAGPADEAYQEARECYNGLHANPELQKHRDQWERCIGQFKDVATRYRRHAKGAEARFSLGKLYAELASNSKNKADWTKSVHEYESFTRQFPRSSLADDAYLNAAKIDWERLNNKDGAMRDLLRIIKFYKDGDMAGEAERYKDAVEKGIVPRDDAPITGARIINESRPVVIVIDPGHGGSDSGAMGGAGTKEKDITLELSRDLAKELKLNLKNAHVFLTRDKDKNLTLDDRTNFARLRNADLFISIHANASTSKKQRGVQTYYLNNATDEAAKRLAGQENKNAGREVSDLAKIIATMLQNESSDQSRNLAKIVHKSLTEGLSKKYSGIVDQNVRSALFYVLVGAKYPSILIETSYITNKKEEERLKDDAYQRTVVSAISSGIQKYLKEQKLLAVNP